jgi:3-hydroxyacyl-CoA dehydrogenase
MSTVASQEQLEAQALAYAKEGDQRAAIIDGLPATVVAAPLHQVGVIGAGTMGAGIALTALNAGLSTVLVEAHAEALAAAQGRIRASLDAALAKGRIDAGERDRRLARLESATAFDRLAGCDVVVEAVFEDMGVKRRVFTDLDRIAKPGALLASNTSTLDVDRIAGATARPESVVGLHFFSPAHVMRLLEVIRGPRTAPGPLATAMQFARKLGKTPVVSGICDGFIGNRMFEEYLRQAYFLLDEGVQPERIDGALERWGMAMGPFAVMDLAGGDIGWAIRKRRAIEQPHRPYSPLPDRLCELGRFGQKTGAGYYRYDAGGKRIVDPAVTALVLEQVRVNGRSVREVSDEEIVLRCVLALVNEGLLLLAEGIAQRGSDIDVVYRNGYGFPAVRGGPLYYADTLGVDKVLDHLQTFQQADCRTPDWRVT